MQFIPYVFDKDFNKIHVSVSRMTKEDALETNREPMWQTSWTSDYLSDPAFEKYAVRRSDELIALAAYEIWNRSLLVHIVYMEAQPESNPTMYHEHAKYSGIGKLLIAYGIKLSIDCGFAGDVTLEAKTSELAAHYAKDFGAVALPRLSSSAPRFLIADDAAKAILLSFLE